jgi:ferredoxin-NADP reductase
VVGVLSAFPWHVGTFYSSPELALLIGNLFAFLTSTHKRLDLTLVSKKEIAKSIYEFSFRPQSPLHFKAGQYLEWTLPHEHEDTRGIRRYFTISSSPSESELKLGVKIIPESSSTYKKALLALNPGDLVYAENLDGDFVLPHNKKQKLVFIAGGIGVTPFRSIVQYMQQGNDKRDAILFYAAKTEEEVAYRDVFAAIPTHYVINEMITEEMMQKAVPDYKERVFYISGPNMMVDNYKKLLKKMGVSGSSIVTDYFPGY